MNEQQLTALIDRIDTVEEERLSTLEEHIDD